LLGRVDLIEILSDSEYKDQIPEAIREKSDCEYHFVVRNPQALVIPK